MTVLDSFFSFGGQKKWLLVAVDSNSNSCMGIGLGGRSIGHLRQVVVL